MANAQVVDLSKPLAGLPNQAAPLFILAFTRRRQEVEGGVPAQAYAKHDYILLQALPEELRRRVELAIQAATAAM